MSADRAPSSLPGVTYGSIARHADERGSFRELWRADDFPGERFVQANLSSSATGVLRGLHLHRRQDDLWVVADGRAFVALVDIRPLLRRSGAARVETRVPAPTNGSSSRPAWRTGSWPSSRCSSSTS